MIVTNIRKRTIRFDEDEFIKFRSCMALWYEQLKRPGFKQQYLPKDYEEFISDFLDMIINDEILDAT